MVGSGAQENVLGGSAKYSCVEKEQAPPIVGAAGFFVEAMFKKLIIYTNLFQLEFEQ
jgi:hypothetical protein